MNNRVIKFLPLLLLCLMSFAKTATAEFRPFYTDSLKQILADRKGQPFLLVLWSIDCPPCLRELEHLGKLRNQFTKQGLVLISTDGSDNINTAETILTKYGLKDTESWVFSGNFPEKLRYHIDNTWYGELPRSYFYNTNHQRTSKSGVLSMEVIQQWIAAMNQVTTAEK